jgi:hypothetical protein
MARRVRMNSARNAQSIGNTLSSTMRRKTLPILAKQGADAFANLTAELEPDGASSDPTILNSLRNGGRMRLNRRWKKSARTSVPSMVRKRQIGLRNQLRHALHGKDDCRPGHAFRSWLSSPILEQATNSLSNAVRSDPSAMPAAIGILDSAITAQVKSHSLDAVTAARSGPSFSDKASNGIAESALFGLAESNPEAAQKALDAGTFDKYFTPGQMQTARRYVETQAKLTTTLVENPEQGSCRRGYGEYPEHHD